jgi:TolA-binding protein
VITLIRPLVRAAAAALIAVFFVAPTCLAQQTGGGPADLAQLYNEGMAQFQRGNFAGAAAMLETLLAKTGFAPQLEPVAYTVGSAWFNAGDYGKAITAFKTYQAKFPHGARSLDVAFGLAQSHLAQKDFSEAATLFATLERDPRFREQALLLQATAYREGGKLDQAIAALEKLAGGELPTKAAARGAMMLAQIYAEKGNGDKAVALVTKLNRNLSRVDNVVELNAMTVQLGDELYKQQRYDEALECYRAARPREQIIRLQMDRIGAMQKLIEDNLAAARADPSQMSQLGAVTSQLKADIARFQQQLDEFNKLPNITPAIYVRLARCFYEADRKWEAVVVYQELLERFPDAAEREPALFGIIVALTEVSQGKRAIARSEEYLREFKDGPNAEAVAYLLGAGALQANDPAAAEGYFTRMLEAQPKTTYREQIKYLLGNARLMAGKFDEARADYEAYLKEYPKGASVEDVVYRIALTFLFGGKYEEAIKALNSYLGKYNSGAFVADARYRLAVCKYAAALYDDVVADCKAWQAQFPQHEQTGEVLALQADAYAAMERDDDAVGAYIESYKVATTDEVMTYSLFAASKLLQKRDRWDKVGDLFAEFIQAKPDHPSVLTALYWIGKAKAREGQAEEAKRITADAIKRYIADPQREAVELLISQLAQLCAKKKRSQPAPDADPGAAEALAVAPTATPQADVDPAVELEALLGGAANEEKSTAKARIIYAAAEVARLRRQPAEEEKEIGRIAEGFRPEDLSPMLLGRVGDYLLAKGRADDAMRFYQQLNSEYPKSEFVDYAYNGLAEIALSRNELNKALRLFSDGTDKIVASQKLKELTVGKGKTLLALGRLEEAKKVFEQVAAVREWRGEATAFSVYSLGEIEARQGRWAEANALFQRVYVGYRKFLPWVAKAYMRSAESFEKLGKTQEAANTYREMLRNEKLANFAEAQEARRKLEALGQQG